jgi:O-antigen/teichoic acid export membrane protein
MSTVRSDLARSALVNFWGILGKVAGPVFLLAANRYYGTDQFGLYAAAYSLVEILNALISAGFKDGVLIATSKYSGREAGEDQLYRNHATAMLLTVGPSAVIGLFGALSAPLLLPLFYDAPYAASLTPLLMWMLPTLPLLAFERMTIAATQGLKMMKYDAWINGWMRPFLLLALSVAFWYAGAPPYGLAIGYAATQLAVFGLSIHIYKQHFSISSLASALTPKLLEKELVRFSLPQNVNMGFNRMVAGLDILLLPAFGLDSVSVGLYATGSMIVRELRNIKLAFSSALAPHIVQLWDKRDIVELSNAVSITASWVMGLLFPVVITIGLFHQEMVGFFVQDISGSTRFMIWLLPVPLFYSFFSLMANVIMMTGHSHLILFNNVAGTAISALAIMLLVPDFGLNGAALASSIAVILVSLLEYTEARHFIKIRFVMNKVYKPFAAAFVPSVLIFIESALDKSTMFVLSMVLYVFIYVVLDYHAIQNKVFSYRKKL